MEDANSAKDGKNFDPQNPVTWKYDLAQLKQKAFKTLRLPRGCWSPIKAVNYG